MDYFNTIENRFSCRCFKDERIPRDLLNKVLEAGILAPTACNYQPERIMVLEDKDLIEKLKDGTRYTFNAKTLLIISHDKNISWHRGNDGVDHGAIDSAIVATHMTLALTALGLGSCFVCSMREALVREILGLPENYQVDIILPIGYPSEVKPHNSRKDLEEIVTFK